MEFWNTTDTQEALNVLKCNWNFYALSFWLKGNNQSSTGKNIRCSDPSSSNPPLSEDEPAPPILVRKEFLFSKGGKCLPCSLRFHRRLPIPVLHLPPWGRTPPPTPRSPPQPGFGVTPEPHVSRGAVLRPRHRLQPCAGQCSLVATWKISLVAVWAGGAGLNGIRKSHPWWWVGSPPSWWEGSPPQPAQRSRVLPRVRRPNLAGNCLVLGGVSHTRRSGGFKLPARSHPAFGWA